ncbi:hypothetical protein [Natrarchaeobius oligotrophus]|uniref:Type I restriction enzyme R protein N-terminal domain-containing protein n=1 Tax=Natrarchaeobius chitinivorans TaxID=1679083 RepID=A0A3N6M7Q6_NATCH|nr:hypothetical protein [Natrarchaeobius chitinivorans]RQG99678.1 hypothetical protein EA472_13560 [Natrarchaeobius chitinivorans]
MTGLDLRPFVTRCRTLVDSAPPTTAGETRTWIVEPFLETLGWNVSADATVVDDAVEDVHLEYVLAVDSIPALFVAVEPYGTALEEARATDLLEAMSWTGVDRALYTNGREYFFLAGTTGVDRLPCRLPALPEHESSIEHFTRADASRRLEGDAPEVVGRRLALERAAIVRSFVERLTAATGGERYAEEFESAADRFVDRLIVSFAGDEYDRFAAGSNDESDASTGSVSFRFSEPSAVDGAVERDDEASVPSGSDETQTADGETIGRDEPAVAGSDEPAAPTGSERADTDEQTVPADADGDGEFVVKFFNDRGSIGAIGHSSSGRALVHAAEYLFDRGLSGVSVPWRPTEDGRVVLNDEPTGSDSESMTSPYQLSNGLYLEVGGGLEDHAERIRALASRAGLRAMLTGDWEDS